MSNAEILSQESSELRELDWVKNQIKAELASLQTEAFYNKNEQTGKIDYNLSTVKSYLETVQDQDRKKLISRNSSAFMMAVQIALESQGYDVGKIDGLRGRATMLQVQSFQKAQGLKADGLPGPETIKAILQTLGSVQASLPSKPTGTPTQGIIPKPEQNKINPDIQRGTARLLDLEKFDPSFDMKLNKEGKGILRGVEKVDRKGTYIQLGKEKYYKDVKDGLGYQYKIYDTQYASIRIGEWKNGELNGEGKLIWSYGGSYQGEFKDGNFGKGTYTLDNGEKWIGEFKENLSRRKGKKVDKNGKIIEQGIFENDKLVKPL